MQNYETFPTPHMEGAVRRYIESGIPPGSFLEAVLRNDLKEACGRADDLNRHCLFEIVRWFYNEAPYGCWGSDDAYESWINAFREQRAAAQ